MSIEKMTERVGSKFMEAGCEKLPEGGMRDNCEKKSKGKKDDGDKKDDKKPDFLKKKDDKKDDKKKAAKKDVPEAFKEEWKNKDKDGDGKTNEPKPDFLKKKKGGVVPGIPDGTGPRHDTEQCSYDDDTPMGVVAAMTQDGKVEIFSASTPSDATDMKEALMKKGGYAKIASGPNVEQRSVNELYDDFEQRWMEAGCEKLPEGGMRDNCEKKSKGKKDDKKEE